MLGVADKLQAQRIARKKAKRETAKRKKRHDSKELEMNRAMRSGAARMRLAKVRGENTCG